MRIYILLIAFLLLACEQKKTSHKRVSKHASYQLIQLGEGELSMDSDITQLRLSVNTLDGDTLYYVPDYSYFIANKFHSLDSIWRTFQQGDSIHLRMKRALLNSYLKLFGVMQKDEGTVELRVRIEASLDSAAAAIKKQEMLSLREIEEQRKLQAYISSFGDSLEYLSGVYRKIVNRTSGNPILPGSEVSIHYRGRFLGGYVFDDTYKKAVTPSFTYGQEYQLLDGIHIALKGLKEGERVKIILPSRHAFGEEGSLAGIVPPYTAVIYDIEIIKVLN